MTKQELLKVWQELPANQSILDKMQPIEAKQKGKTFGLDGIRIDGSEAFVFAVLSRLQDLIAGENNVTRLQLSMNDCSKAEGDFNKGNGGNVCYIRLRTRTLQGSATSAFFDRDLHKATEQYAEAIKA